MALIGMAVYDTAENDRTKYTEKTLQSLLETVDFNKHRLFIYDNNSCEETKNLLRLFAWDLKMKYDREGIYTVITGPENIGTAEAINHCWKHRAEGEHCVKMDNDVVIHQSGWLDDLEEAVRREPVIGQCALKRPDIWENPDHESPLYKSTLMMLPHKPGEKWMVAESVNHCIGTCVLHSSALLDRVGYLKQPKHYGFDDSLMSLRSRIAGFKNVFLPYIPISHIDAGDNPYTEEKCRLAGEYMQEYAKLRDGYNDKTIDIYYNPFQ